MKAANTSRARVSMIWRTTPRQAEVSWFSQRYMMERLSEELARARALPSPYLALGEVKAAMEDIPEENATIPDWIVPTIAKGKRRCDVAGQYGLGFMLLMVHTPIEGDSNAAGACNNPSSAPRSRCRGPMPTCMPSSASAAPRPAKCLPFLCSAVPSKISKRLA